jgi:hypothetical protein
MHALTTVFSMDPAKKAQLIEGLDPVVIAHVRGMPGFVTGFWTWDHATNVAYGMVIFDTDKNARSLETFLRDQAEDMAAQGTRLERAAVGEVIGAASGDASHKVDGAALWQRFGR